MLRDSLILPAFIVLAFIVFVIVVRNGIPTRLRLCCGIGSLVVLSAVAIGLHWFLKHGSELAQGVTFSVSLNEMGLGVFLLVLASLGCLCVDQKE